MTEQKCFEPCWHRLGCVETTATIRQTLKAQKLSICAATTFIYEFSSVSLLFFCASWWFTSQLVFAAVAKKTKPEYGKVRLQNPAQLNCNTVVTIETVSNLSRPFHKWGSQSYFINLPKIALRPRLIFVHVLIFL